MKINRIPIGARVNLQNENSRENRNIIEPVKKWTHYNSFLLPSFSQDQIAPKKHVSLAA